eukprot:2071554-Pleurochrysis_carterae.AAC.1
MRREGELLTQQQVHLRLDGVVAGQLKCVFQRRVAAARAHAPTDDGARQRAAAATKAEEEEEVAAAAGTVGRAGTATAAAVADAATGLSGGRSPSSFEGSMAACDEQKDEESKQCRDV